MKTSREWMEQLTGLHDPALVTVNRMAIKEIQDDARKDFSQLMEIVFDGKNIELAKGESIGWQIEQVRTVLYEWRDTKKKLEEVK